jgi:two-component system NtrC family sensor kinase
MKIFSIGLLLLILEMPGTMCQTLHNTDSIKRLLMQNSKDTSRVLLLAQLAGNYRFFNPDSSIIIAQQAIDMAQMIHFNKGKVRALNMYGEARRFQGEFPQSLAAHFNALQISKNIDDKEGEAQSLGLIGLVYLELDENRQAFTYLYQARKINEHLSNHLTEVWLSAIGYGYLKMNMLDSALIFEQQAEVLLNARPVPISLGALILTRLGTIHWKLGHQDIALQYFQDAINISYITGDLLNRGRTQYQIAELYDSVNQQDSSLHYCKLAFENGERISQKGMIVLNASRLMAKLYKAQNNLDSAFYYQKIATAANDSLYGREKFQQLQLLILTEQQRQQQLRENQIQFQRIVLLSALAVFLLIALLLWRNIRQQQRTNKTLSFKNSQIETQRNILEKTL